MYKSNFRPKRDQKPERKKCSNKKRKRNKNYIVLWPKRIVVTQEKWYTDPLRRNKLFYFFWLLDLIFL